MKVEALRLCKDLPKTLLSLQSWFDHVNYKYEIRTSVQDSSVEEYTATEHTTVLSTLD